MFRSPELASKKTGYPIAKVVTKLATITGYSLNEIRNGCLQYIITIDYLYNHYNSSIILLVIL